HALSSNGGAEPDILATLEQHVSALAQFASGAASRLEADDCPPSSTVATPVSSVVSRVLSGTDPVLDPQALGTSTAKAPGNLPAALGRLISGILWQLADLPAERPSAEQRVDLSMEVQLPAWIPQRRVLGAFYVQRALGKGGAGSVFVVNRVEDRH